MARHIMSLVLAIACFFIVGMIIAGRMEHWPNAYRAVMAVGVGGVGIRRLLMFIYGVRERPAEGEEE